MAKKKAKSASLNKSVSVKTYQLSIFLVLFAFVGAYSLMQTFAAPGGKGGGGGKPSSNSSLTYSMLADANGDGMPNWGDTIRFNPVTDATTQPHVELLCSQSGSLVYSATAGYFDSYPWPWTQEMSLKSNAWTAGAADCVARLYLLNAKAKTGTTTLATLSFKVES